MATEPLASAESLLTDHTNAVKSFYRPGEQIDEYGRFGKATGRIFKMSSRRIDGDGIIVGVESSKSYPTRWNKDVNAAFRSGQAHTDDTFKATISETAADNDFSRADASAQATYLDVNRAVNDRAYYGNFIEKKTGDIVGSFDESLAAHRHLPQSALIAQVNTATAAVAGNGATTYAAAFAADPTASPGTGARFPIDGGSLAAVRPNMEMDAYDTAGAFTGTVRVTDFNASDKSVGIILLDANGDVDNATDPDDIVKDNYSLYMSGEKDQGPISIGAWFEEPTAGESFLTKDRTDAVVRGWMRPHFYNPGAGTNVAFSHNYINDLGSQMAFIDEDPDGAYVAVTTPGLEQAYRDEVGGDVVVQVSSTNAPRLIANAGFNGMMYHHPMLGNIVFQVDALAPPGKIRFLKLGDWETLFATGSSEKVDFLPGDAGMGSWYRMNQNTPNTGRGTVYKIDALTHLCDICTRPREQAELSGLIDP